MINSLDRQRFTDLLQLFNDLLLFSTIYVDIFQQWIFLIL